MKKTRRKFIKQGSQVTLGMGLLGWTACGGGETNSTNNSSGTTKPTTNTTATSSSDVLKISLAQWSLHKALGMRGDTPTMDNLDFAAKAKSFGIDGIEYVNQFFKDKATDKDYLKEMIKRADDNGVKNLLIMIDREGDLAEPDQAVQKAAIENH